MALHAAVAILPCRHVPTSLAFYARLGFVQTHGDEQYAMLSDGQGAELHLRCASDEDLTLNSAGLYVYVEDVDGLASRFPGEILGAAGKPEIKVWGTYEFALSDPDGALVRVGRPTRDNA